MTVHAFNLIRSPWLPVVRESHAVEWISPSEINDGIDDDPIVGFAWPRPDFNGAAHEFLIGLLSTASPPENDDDWENWWRDPPPPPVLQQRFDEFADAFDLDGPGPRFLQDKDPLEGADSKGIAALLIDAPGAQTLRHNADLFVKRGGTPVLCRAAAAMALYTLNAYAPTGGAGHRTSLRGGGPMTTLMVVNHQDRRRTLWDRLWPNVETVEQTNERAPGRIPRDRAAIFPWLDNTRTSNKKHGGRTTTPADVHPLQAYWGMPRRIRLIFEDADTRPCGLTGTDDATVVATYRTKNYGIDYSEGFEHPLTPYYKQKAGTAKLAVHPKPGGITYRLWPGVVCVSGDQLSTPARVVGKWPHRRPADSGQTRIVAFGYDMDNMKARAWVEGEMPLHLLDDPHLQGFLEAFLTNTVAGANRVARLLTKAVKAAHHERPGDARGDYGFVAERFYRETETLFHIALAEARQLIHTSGDADDPTEGARAKWPKSVSPVAMRLFDEYAPMDGLEDRNMARHVKARHYLAIALSGRGGDGRSLFEKDLGIIAPRTESGAQSGLTHKNGGGSD